MWVVMCLYTVQVQDMGSCVCVLPWFKIWVAMCLCTAQLLHVGSYVFVYCPGSRCG